MEQNLNKNKWNNILTFIIVLLLLVILALLVYNMIQCKPKKSLETDYNVFIKFLIDKINEQNKNLKSNNQCFIDTNKLELDLKDKYKKNAFSLLREFCNNSEGLSEKDGEIFYVCNNYKILKMNLEKIINEYSICKNGEKCPENKNCKTTFIKNPICEFHFMKKDAYLF